MNHHDDLDPWPRARTAVAVLSLIVGLLPACSNQADQASQVADTSPQDLGASLVPADVPAEFQYVWIGDNRSVPALSDDERLSSIFMFGSDPASDSGPEPARLSFFEELPSLVTELDTEQMTVVITDDGAGCRAGDTGTYRWSLSAAGDELRLDLVDDACATRAAALPGTWTRSDCPLFPDDFCLGDLAPGTHRSSFFDPFATPDAWRYRRGVLTYTVRAGWANTGDYPGTYVLAPDSDEPDTGIYLSSEISVISDDSPCSAIPNTTVARTPSEMAEWIVNRPGIVETEPVDVIVGGLPGLSVDLVADAGVAETCTGDGPYLPLFTGAQDGGLQWGLGADQRMRVYLLDLGDDRTLVILIQGTDEPAYEALLAEADGIVGSFRLDPAE